jgi:hypothetical protein
VLLEKREILQNKIKKNHYSIFNFPKQLGFNINKPLPISELFAKKRPEKTKKLKKNDCG